MPVDFVDERLKVRGSSTTFGSSPSNGGIAFAGALKDSLQGAVAQARVWIVRHSKNASRVVFTLPQTSELGVERRCIPFSQRHALADTRDNTSPLPSE